MYLHMYNFFHIETGLFFSDKDLGEAGIYALSPAGCAMRRKKDFVLHVGGSALPRTLQGVSYLEAKPGGQVSHLYDKSRSDFLESMASAGIYPTYVKTKHIK